MPKNFQKQFLAYPCIPTWFFEVKNTKIEAIIYLVANIAVAMVPFLLMPILTRELGPKGYGEVTMFLIAINLSGAVVGLSTHGAISARWFNKKGLNLKEYVSSCILINFMAFFVVLIFVNVFISYFVDVLSISKFWINTSVAISFLNSLLLIRLVIWQLNGKAMKYGLLQTFLAITIGCGSYFLVVNADFGVEGRLWGHALGYIVFSLLSLLSLVIDRNLTFRVNILCVKDILSFGVPLIPHVIGGFLLATIDRVILKEYLGIESVGVYMVAVQVSLGLYILADAFNKAFMPWLFRTLSGDELSEKIKIVKVSYAFAISLLLFAIVSFYFSSYIINLIAGNEFSDGEGVLPILILAQAFQGMYFLVTNYIFYTGKTYLTATITICSGVFGVLITLLLVNDFGMLGAAIGQLAGMVALWLLTWHFANKVYPMPWFSIFKVRREVCE